MTGDGRYLYCIISGNWVNPGRIGIEKNEVYAIQNKDISLLVHSCTAQPYSTADDEKACEWILAHNYVIDLATEKFGTVLPFSFDAIVRGNDDTVKEWLGTNYYHFRDELNRLKNKAEYSVQVFCEQEKLALPLENDGKAEHMSKGAAYLFQQRSRLKLKAALSAEISRLASDFYARVKAHVEEIRIEDRIQVQGKYRDKKLIVALSCLVREDMTCKLGEMLDEINKREGYAVRFSGPWAPFSFVRTKGF